MRVAVLYNPVSGAGRSETTARRLESRLRGRGWKPELVPTQRGEPEKWLEPALEHAAACVVAGGDGAMRLVAPSVGRRGVPVWHAPCGTENLFARAFGMSADPSAVIGAIDRRDVRRVDLADANGVPFAIMASVGFDADVVHALSARRTGAITHWSYAAPIVGALRSWRPSELSWEVDGERERLGKGMAVVGNLRHYGGRLNPAAEARCDDGLLDAVFIPADSALALLPWLPLLWTGLHLRHPMVRQRRAERIVLEASEPVLVQLDGDAGPMGAVRRLELRALPAALAVLQGASGPRRPD